MGDDTRGRIDEIADGWRPGKKSDSDAAADSAAPEPQKVTKSGRTVPPPPPGSPERQAAVSKSAPIRAEASRPAVRKQGSGAPPPIPTPAKPRSEKKKPARIESTQDRRSLVIRSSGPRPATVRANGSPAAAGAPPTVEVRGDQSEAPTVPVIGGPKTIVETLSPGGALEDPTLIPTGEEEFGFSKRESAPRRTDSLPTPASIPRRPGLLGDLGYVISVAVGRRRARRGLVETGQEIEAEKRSRDKEFIELARLAISDTRVTGELIEEAREHLVGLEEARARKAGAAAAAEETIAVIERERDKVKRARVAELAELEVKITELDDELAPLAKQIAALKRRIRVFKRQLQGFDDRIAAEDEQASSRSEPDAVAEAEASIASLRAEREALFAEEPPLAEELGDLAPRIRELKARRNELARAQSKLRRAEDESIVRSEERLAAARAHKAVVDRAAQVMARDQQELLCDVGAKLYEDPPAPVAHLATPLAERDAKLEKLKSGAVELREKLDCIESWPLVRGALLWVVVAAIAGAAVWYFAIR